MKNIRCLPGVLGTAGLLFALLLAPACTPASTSAGAWLNPKPRVSEVAALDLGVRVLGLELNRQSQGRFLYELETLPQRDLVRAVCIFQGEPPASRQELEEILQFQTKLLEGGVREVAALLSLGETFDPTKNLEARFVTRGANAREIAAYHDGELHWVVSSAP